MSKLTRARSVPRTCPRKYVRHLDGVDRAIPTQTCHSLPNEKSYGFPPCPCNPAHACPSHREKRTDSRRYAAHDLIDLLGRVTSNGLGQTPDHETESVRMPRTSSSTTTTIAHFPARASCAPRRTAPASWEQSAGTSATSPAKAIEVIHSIDGGTFTSRKRAGLPSVRTS